MKNIILAIILTTLISCDNNSNESVATSSRKVKYENIDSFSHQIYTYIMKDSANALNAHLPSQNELESIFGGAIHEAIANGLIDSQEAKRDGMLDTNPNASIELKKLFNENYRKFKHYSKGENFSGKEFRLIYTDFKHTRNGNIESLDITYILRKGNQKKNIEIVVRGCIKSKESWLLGEKIDFPSGRVRENQGGMYFYPNY